MSGAVVAARFELERCLGRGGMGEVWAAKNTQTGKRVALKLLHAEVSGDGHRSRLVREAKAAGALDHPNVCEVLDVVEHAGLPVLVLPLLEGQTLAERLARESPLPLREACAIMARAAAGVAAAHAAGVVHRDLKPANIFLERSGGVRVLDFGIAKLSAADAEKLTSTGAVLGTPAYMSPEQALGEGDVDHKSDLWSLGIVLFESLTGRLLTEADNVGQILKKVLFQPIPSINEELPEAPPALARLLRDMLQRKRKARLGDAREVASALAGIAGIDVVIAGPPTVPAGDSVLPEAPSESATTHDAKAGLRTTRGGTLPITSDKDPTASAIPRNRAGWALPAVAVAAVGAWLVLGRGAADDARVPAPPAVGSRGEVVVAPVSAAGLPPTPPTFSVEPRRPAPAADIALVEVATSSAPSARAAAATRSPHASTTATPTATAAAISSAGSSDSASQTNALRDRR